MNNKLKKCLNSNEPYLIAETAYSFEGNVMYLLNQVDELDLAIDGIKFHMMLDVDSYAINSSKISSFLKSWIIDPNDWYGILTSSKAKGFDNIVLADDVASLDFCKKHIHLVDAIEIHAACVNDIELLEKAIQICVEYDIVFIIGISGFHLEELYAITDFVQSFNYRNILYMYGFQNFPTNIEELNLSRMKTLRQLSGFNVGYADHTEYSNSIKDSIINTAYSLGANIQEVHYVLEEGRKVTDYITAVSTTRLKKIKNMLILTKSSIGKLDFRLSTGEKKYLNFRKVAVYNRDYKKGSTIDCLDFSFKRVDIPVRQHNFGEMTKVGQLKFTKDVKKNKEIDFRDYQDRGKSND